MDIFGDLERFISEDLYPYRYAITIGCIAVVAGIVAFGIWRGWHKVIWDHRALSAVIGIPVIVVTIVAGNYFLSPLWERSTLCEASPIAGAGSGSEDCDDDNVALAATNPPTVASSPTPAADPAVDPAADPPAATQVPAATEAPAFEAAVVAQGQFVGADDFHFGEGDAILIETAPGTYTLRFENFSVRNGPDLFVYLSPDPAGYAEGALNLGDLKATDGAFNYEIPAGTDVSQFKSAIVWCEAFSVLFATAAFQ